MDLPDAAPLEAAPRAWWKIRRRTWFLATCAILLGPWLWMAAATPAPVDFELGAVPENRPYELALLDRGYHTALLIEQPAGFSLGPPDAPTSRYVEYAWGDRRFFKDSNFWPHALVAAAFLPSASVVYVSAWNRVPDSDPEGMRVYRRKITAKQMKALLKSLEQAFRRTHEGERPEAFGSVPEYRGRFFPGRESYIFWSNCNGWVQQRLSDAGLADTSRTTMRPASVVEAFRRGGD